MNKIQIIAILGGAGRTGSFVISRLLQQRFHLRVLIRDPNHFKVNSGLIEYVYGDALDKQIISTLLHGCQAVISTIGQRKNEPLVAAVATHNIVEQMQVQGIRRYIQLAGLNIDTPVDQKSTQTLAATEWMKRNFPEIQQDRQAAYAKLIASNIDWTLVRVPMIDFVEGLGHFKVNLFDCPGMSISAGDIAKFITDQLYDKEYLRQSPFISN